MIFRLCGTKERHTAHRVKEKRSSSVARAPGESGQLKKEERKREREIIKNNTLMTTMRLSLLPSASQQQ